MHRSPGSARAAISVWASPVPVRTGSPASTPGPDRRHTDRGVMLRTCHERGRRAPAWASNGTRPQLRCPRWSQQWLRPPGSDGPRLGATAGGVHVPAQLTRFAGDPLREAERVGAHGDVLTHSGPKTEDADPAGRRGAAPELVAVLARIASSRTLQGKRLSVRRPRARRELGEKEAPAIAGGASPTRVARAGSHPESRQMGGRMQTQDGNRDPGTRRRTAGGRNLPAAHRHKAAAHRSLAAHEAESREKHARVTRRATNHTR